LVAEELPLGWGIGQVNEFRETLPWLQMGTALRRSFAVDEAHEGLVELPADMKPRKPTALEFRLSHPFPNPAPALADSLRLAGKVDQEPEGIPAVYYVLLRSLGSCLAFGLLGVHKMQDA
jgi:hypothetical protein